MVISLCFIGRRGLLFIIFYFLLSSLLFLAKAFLKENGGKYFEIQNKVQSFFRVKIFSEHKENNDQHLMAYSSASHKIVAASLLLCDSASVLCHCFYFRAKLQNFLKQFSLGLRRKCHLIYDCDDF